MYVVFPTLAAFPLLVYLLSAEGSADRLEPALWVNSLLGHNFAVVTTVVMAVVKAAMVLSLIHI